MTPIDKAGTKAYMTKCKRSHSLFLSLSGHAKNKVGSLSGERDLKLRSGFEPPDLDRPGRLPHQQGLCEARLGYQDESPQLGGLGPLGRSRVERGPARRRRRAPGYRDKRDWGDWGD